MRAVIAALAVAVVLVASSPAQATRTPVGLMINSDYEFLRTTRYRIAQRLAARGIPIVALDDGARSLWMQASAKGEDPANYMLLGANPFKNMGRVVVVDISYQDYHGRLVPSIFGELARRLLGRSIVIGDLIAFGTIQIYDRQGNRLRGDQFIAVVPVVNGNYQAWEKVLAEAVTGQVTSKLSTLLQ